MKKLVLLILSFTLSFQVFAQEISKEYLDKALEIERNYLLAVTTGNEGEHTIGKRPYGRIADSTPTFYISTKKCKTDRCFQSRDRAYNSAVTFANDYNQLMKDNGLSNKSFITVSSKENLWNAVPIHLVDNLNSAVGRWNCGKGVKRTGNRRMCNIKILIGGNSYIPNVVAHEMLNIVAFEDTRQSEFDGCISSDKTYLITTYEGLCEVEKRAIVFALNHLRPGMRKGAVGNAFDKYWQKMDEEFLSTTVSVAEEVKLVLDSRLNFCQKFKSASCLKEFPSLALD